jgi:hypothetical protein
MTNSAKGLLSFALVLFFVNGAHFLSDPPLAYKTTLPVYMNIELSESRVWDVEVRTESGKKLNFEDTIRYYAKAIRGKKQSRTEITRHKLLPTTDLTGTRAPVVIAAEISGGRLVESVSLAFSGGMTADDLDAVIFSIGEKVTQLNAEDLLLFPENKDGSLTLPDSIRYTTSGFSGGINRMGALNDVVLFLTHPLASPAVLLYAVLLWLLAAFFLNRRQGGLENAISGVFSIKFDVSVKTEIVALAALAALAFLFRINGITRMNVFSDEIYAAITADPNKPFMTTFSDPGNPPLYYILLRCWSSLFGWNELTGKTLSVLTGSLFVVTIWYFVRTLLGRKQALIAAGLVTVSAYAIYWSHVLRTYSLLLTLTPLALAFFLNYFRNGKIKYLVLYALTCVALVNSHYYGVFVVMANAALLVAYQLKARTFSIGKNVPFFAANALVALSLVPFLMYMGFGGGLMNGGFNDMSVPSGKVSRAVFFAYKTIAYIGGFFSSNIALFGGFCVMCVFLARTLFRNDKNEKIASKYRFALWYSLGLSAIVIILAFSISMIRPMMKEKYFIVLYPSIVTILILFFCPIQGASRKPIQAIVFVLLLLGISGDMYFPTESAIFNETARYISLDNARYESFAVREHMKVDKPHEHNYNEYYSFFIEEQGSDAPVYYAGEKTPVVMYGHQFADGPIPDDMTHFTNVNIRGRYVTKYYSDGLISSY